MDTMKGLLPKHKHDDSTIGQLRQLTEEEMKPLIGPLLEWLQDFNWPIAEKVLPVIASYQAVAMPHVVSILRGNDWVWIYWILSCLVPLLTESSLRMIKDDLLYLSLLEGTDEDVLEVIQLSKECLAAYF